MPRRMTKTEKWEDDWFVSLEPQHKLFWFYLCDRCDHAGIWQVSKVMAELFIGQAVNLDAALVAFGDRIDASKDGYWRLTKFIEFQYGLPLGSSAVHKSALKILERLGYDTGPFLRVIEPLDNPSERVKDKDKDKDKDSSIPSSDLKPTSIEEFEIFWKAYPKRQAKGAAKEEWLKHKPPLSQCLSTLAWQVRDIEWTKDGGKWIPWPQKWIKHSRWLDEKESGRGHGQGHMERPAGMKFDDKGEVIF